MKIIKTPKPPLNIFNVSRVNIKYIPPTGTEPDLEWTWTTVYDVEIYEIPATPISPPQEVQTSVIMTGLLISNLSNMVVDVSVRIKKIVSVNPEIIEYFTILNRFPIPRRDFTTVKLDRQILKPSEELQVVCLTNPSDMPDQDIISANFSYVLNQAESYTVIP